MGIDKSERTKGALAEELKAMQQNKMILAAVWIACLTIAAYVFAQAAVMIMSRGLDVALLMNAVPVIPKRSESDVSLQPRLNASDRNKSVSVPEGDIGCNVKVEQVSDTRWILDRASLLADTRDLNRYLMQARAVPYINRGRTMGFQISRISRGSFYEKIGLQNGDVLRRINTQNLDIPAKLFRLYQQMRKKQHIVILLSRNGQNLTFDYDIR